MDAERAHLAALGERLRAGLARLGIDSGGSTTQIVPAIVGGEEDALRLSALLDERGMIGCRDPPADGPARHQPPAHRACARAMPQGDVDALLAALEDAR